MMKKMDSILNIVIGSCVGVFVGRGIYEFWHYKTYPDLYAMQSAPWYTGVLVNGIFTAAAVAASALIKYTVRSFNKRKANRSD